jgi:hypothetical protein
VSLALRFRNCYTSIIPMRLQSTAQPDRWAVCLAELSDVTFHAHPCNQASAQSAHNTDVLCCCALGVQYQKDQVPKDD